MSASALVGRSPNRKAILTVKDIIVIMAHELEELLATYCIDDRKT